jgi:hypothetical protein
MSADEHTVRITGQLWSCTCGAGGRQPDEQRARLAARIHARVASRRDAR